MVELLEVGVKLMLVDGEGLIVGVGSREGREIRDRVQVLEMDLGEVVGMFGRREGIDYSRSLL